MEVKTTQEELSIHALIFLCAIASYVIGLWLGSQTLMGDIFKFLGTLLLLVGIFVWSRSKRKVKE